ncbi:hypothetical protein CcaverHIS641_0306360 [Cutaneotrichosporon cavernicola]|nr:hypothetical protein CcaverHIS641_0306360 [Cutaneotrichosporon cavernicola]
MSSDDETYGPALPPGLVRKKTTGPSPPRSIGSSRSPSKSQTKIGPSIGPALPRSLSLHHLPYRPIKTQSSWAITSWPCRGPSPKTPWSLPPPPGPAVSPPSDDDSDDEIGPQLSDVTSVPQRSAADTFRDREARIARAREEAANAPKKPQRDEWMTLGPPTGLSHIDALKRPTQFQNKSREAAAVDQAWMETPVERAQRERDEAQGVKRKPTGEDERDRDTKRRRDKDDEMRRRVDEHNKSSRGASLMEQHQAKKKDASPPPIWDRERMMGVGSMLSGEERVKKIKDAANLGDRFGHGRGGAYM